MLEFIGLLVVMGLLDSLNPFSIGLLIVLLSIVKNKYHIIWYVVGIYITNLIGGLAIYAGLDAVVQYWFSKIDFGSVLISILMIFFGFVLLIFTTLQIPKKNNLDQIQKHFSDYPLSLFFLGVAGTATDLPSAFPYYAVLAGALENNLSLLEIFPFLVVYCLIYIMPLLIILTIYKLLSDKVLTPILKKINHILPVVNKYLVIIFGTTLALFLVVSGIFSLINRPLW